MGPLCQEGKEDPDNDGLSRPSGGESLTAPTIIGQALDDRGVAVEPLYPDLIEQLPVTPFVDSGKSIIFSDPIKINQSEFI